MDKIDFLTKKVIEFRDAREWKQFHNPKDIAVSLALEASEVLEHFQWRNGQDLEEYIKSHKSHLADELADVLYWILLMSHDLDIDIADALEQKLIKNAEKYTIEKAKGSYAKYDQL